MMYWDGGWGGWAFMAISMLMFLPLVTWAIVLVIRALNRSRSEQQTSGSSAERILEDRFARGEIDRQEFENRSETLRTHAGR